MSKIPKIPPPAPSCIFSLQLAGQPTKQINRQNTAVCVICLSNLFQSFKFKSLSLWTSWIIDQISNQLYLNSHWQYNYLAASTSKSCWCTTASGRLVRLVHFSSLRYAGEELNQLVLHVVLHQVEDLITCLMILDFFVSFYFWIYCKAYFSRTFATPALSRTFMNNVATRRRGGGREKRQPWTGQQPF